MIDKMLEKFEAMPIDDLFGTFSDWYKDVNGVRPRHIDRYDRESIMEWIATDLERTFDNL